MSGLEHSLYSSHLYIYQDCRRLTFLMVPASIRVEIDLYHPVQEALTEKEILIGDWVSKNLCCLGLLCHCRNFNHDILFELWWEYLIAKTSHLWLIKVQISFINFYFLDLQRKFKLYKIAVYTNQMIKCLDEALFRFSLQTLWLQ